MRVTLVEKTLAATLATMRTALLEFYERKLSQESRLICDGEKMRDLREFCGCKSLPTSKERFENTVR